MNQKEFLAYFLVFLLMLIVTSIGAVFTDSPNFQDPSNPDPPSQPTVNDPTNQASPPPPPETTSQNNFQTIFYILMIIAGAILLYFLIQALSRSQLLNSFTNRRNKVVSSQRRQLEDARIAAYRIIEQGLVSQKYTRAYVEAYIALDKGLDNYREIMRPKHITPKEYAFSVSPPVFKPGVYRTVSTYYNIRFGMMEASEKDLLAFRTQLDNLFIDDVNDEVKSNWNVEFEKILKSDYNFEIPRYTDHTRPGGK